MHAFSAGVFVLRAILREVELLGSHEEWWLRTNAKHASNVQPLENSIKPALEEMAKRIAVRRAARKAARTAQKAREQATKQTIRGLEGELDELRRELAEIRAQNAQLQAEREEDRRRRPGPATTNVLAGFVVVGGLMILSMYFYDLNGLADKWPRPSIPLAVWVGISGAIGLAATLVLANVNRLPITGKHRILRIGIGIGGGFLALYVAFAVLRGAIGSTQYATGGDPLMLGMSLIVGVVVALILRAMGAFGWRQRI